MDLAQNSVPPAHPALVTGDHLPALSGWLEYQLAGWDAWATPRDQSWLRIESGNPAFPQIGSFMRHAFTPLHRYSDQVAGADPIDDVGVSIEDWSALSTHAWACLMRHREVCSSVSVSDWPRIIEFKTRSAGILKVSTALALTHAATHCVWHLGGVAHLLRSRGTEPPSRSDLIFTGLVTD